MLFIKYKVELNVKWTNHYVLSVVVADKNDASSNNIIFTKKDTKLYVSVANQSRQSKTSKILTKWF